MVDPNLYKFDTLALHAGQHPDPATGAPRHVLVLQGIVDTYILPPIANALTLALGLELAGPALDGQHPYTRSAFTPFLDVAGLAGCGPTTLPAQGNRTWAGQATTAVLMQFPEDGVEDGHEVVFQTELPKVQYQCFLKTFRETGTGYVPEKKGDPNCPE